MFLTGKYSLESQKWTFLLKNPSEVSGQFTMEFKVTFFCGNEGLALYWICYSRTWKDDAVPLTGNKNWGYKAEMHVVWILRNKKNPERYLSLIWLPVFFCLVCFYRLLYGKTYSANHLLERGLPSNCKDSLKEARCKCL